MAKSKRKAISKKTRFEVFKRDSFTCQYCGRSAPDVILEVDHINPVNNGGDNDILNLITSCFDCNRGKGKKKLSDKEETKLQIEQLKEINLKREQLEMLLKWKKELESFEDEQVDKIEALFSQKTGYKFSKNGRERCKKNISEFGFEEVYESTNISINQYYDETDKENSSAKIFEYIGRICNVRNKQKNDSNIAKINYLIKIAKNNFDISIQDNIKVRNILKTHFVEMDFTTLKDIFSESYSWYRLRQNLEYFYEEEF